MEILVRNANGTPALWIENGQICDENVCATVVDQIDDDAASWLNSVDPAGHTLETDVMCNVCYDIEKSKWLVID